MAGGAERWAVLGGGIAGLAFAQRAASLRPDLEVVVLEASSRAGGLVHGERSEGFLCEWGPQGVLSGAGPTEALAAELGLAQRWVPRREGMRDRFVLHGRRLLPLPLGPGGFLRSRLLSPTGKLRLLAEVFMPRLKPGSLPAHRGESIAAFARRRFGRQAAQRLADPMATGIFAGDPDRLELEACLPRLAAMERRQRSLLVGFLRARPKPAVLRTFPEGMGALAEALSRALGGRLHTGCEGVAVRREGDLLRVETRDRREGSFVARRVVCCLPAPAAARVLHALDPLLAGELPPIEAVPIVSVHLGFREEEAAGRLAGYGYLVPHHAGGAVLGCLYVGSLFPGHAPSGATVVRFLLGGQRAPGVLAMEDRDLVEACTRHLARHAGVEATPFFSHVHRVARALPQYTLGHTARLARIQERLARIPGLHLLGAAYRGVALNDLVAEARATAEALAGRVGRDPGRAACVPSRPG